ncbi:MAG: M23 family metallopeptidase, partial [Chloroflexota bacterium]
VNSALGEGATKLFSPQNGSPDDNLNRLLDPEIEQAELERIFDIASGVSDEPFWGENSFVAPSPNAELTSPFGAVRVFNEELQTVHTGWDFNAPTGTPLMATAAGEVVFAGQLDIRGNYVLVNHGRGIYSGYAHLSVIFVTQGQPVSEGQVVGTVGSTGRSSSAHAHFEMIANGIWIDATDFVQMYVP